MKKIGVVTATRAEYGLLSPLIRRIYEDTELRLDLMVTGTHLAEKYGHTIDEIKKDGFPIAHEIQILDEDNDPYGISITMANAIRGFAKCFRDDRTDMVVILGDRTEMLGVASAAMNERIPIAHIHGGEVTEGAVDDCVRHALTKMSYLHFTTTEIYRQRVIQLGESPDRVFNVGALGAENILGQEFLSKEELFKQIPSFNKCNGREYAIVTFHPVTLEDDTVEKEVNELCASMADQKDIFFLITASNADAGGEKANKLLREFTSSHENAGFVDSLGMKKYLSAVKYASFVLGNSSSGILEAPVLGTPTVNIGDRQKGRITGATVINCNPDKESIDKAIRKAVDQNFRNSIKDATNPYGDGHTSEKIMGRIKEFLINDKIDIKKKFYDTDFKV